jgi:hypothetical protein
MASVTRTGAGSDYPATGKPVWPAHERAAHYREQAAQFRRMAHTETHETARDRLLELAQQYDRLVTRLDTEATGEAAS